MRKNKVVAYMRFSSENQSVNSIESQRMAIQNFCLANKLNLVDEYVDEALSGTTDRRPSFQRLIKDATNSPDWSAVVVYDPSRFARNENDAFYYCNLLKDHDIRLIFTTLPSEDDSPEKELMTGIMFNYSAYFSKDLAKRTHNGLTCRAKKGIHCGGVPPLGYEVVNQKLAVNEVEAAVVREIFTMYLRGMSYKEMADYLNSKGILTRAGKKFTKNSFNNLLSQEKYIGTYRWNKRKAKDSKGKKTNRKCKPLEKQVVIEDGCPAIIDIETFNRVQEKLAQRSHGRAESKSRYHYTLGGLGIMHCSSCGAPMVGKVTTSHGRKYTSYACPNHRDKGCPTKDITADGVDRYVTAAIALNLIRKDTLSVLNIAVDDYIGNDELGLLNAKINRVKRRINNISNTLADNPSKTLIEKLRGHEEELEKLEMEKKTLLVHPTSIAVEDIKPLRKSLAKKLRTSNDPAVRSLLSSCVEDIIVDNDGITVSLSM